MNQHFLCNIPQEDLCYIVKIDQESFNHNTIGSVFGEELNKEKFSWLSSNQSAILLVCKKESQITGFVYGGSPGYKNHMYKHLFFKCVRNPLLFVKCFNLKKMSNLLELMSVIFLSNRKTNSFNLRNLKEPMIELTSIAVSDKFRNQGLASELLDTFTQVAYNLGYSTVYLKTNTANHPAKNLYMKKKWKVIGRDGKNIYFVKEK